MTGSDWRVEEIDGITLVRCAAIEAIPGVAHAFSTRLAFGRTDFDLGGVDGPDGNRVARSAAFLRAAGLGAAQPAIIRQVHGSVVVDAESLGANPPAADGVIRVAREGALSPVPVVRTADCVAIVLGDRRGSVVAAVHAGWRGAAAGIGANAVARFAALGVDPTDLVVALGPAILGCCFEVGEEVGEALGAACGKPSLFVARTPSGRALVDLHAALRQQLVDAGVPSDAIHAAPWCTRCRRDLFFSYRGDGPGTGRLIAAVGPASGP